MGTTNFGDDVFLNPWPFVIDLYQLSQEREVVPEFELFDLGHVHALHRLLDKYGLPYGGRVHCDLVMGVPGGMPGTADALVAAVSALPAAVTSLVGDRHRPVDAAGGAGGALQGRPPARRHGGRADPRPRACRSSTTSSWSSAPSSSAAMAQRDPMTPAEARELLQVKRSLPACVSRRAPATSSVRISSAKTAAPAMRTPAQHVGLGDARGARRTGCTASPARRANGREQVRQRSGQRQVERLGAVPGPRTRRPRRSATGPRRPRRHGRRRADRERLVAALRRPRHRRSVTLTTQLGDVMSSTSRRLEPRMPFEIPENLHPDCAPGRLAARHLARQRARRLPDDRAVPVRPGAASSPTTAGRSSTTWRRAWIVDENGEKVRDAAMETGFLRPQADGALELVLAPQHRLRRDLVRRAADGGRLEMTTDAVARTETAKEYAAGKRIYGYVEGDLLYAYDMAAMGQELQPHLWARLQRGREPCTDASWRRPAARAAATG